MLKFWPYVLVIVIACIFAYYVWPTPFSNYILQGNTVQVNRINKCQYVVTPLGPETIENDGRCFLKSETNRKFGEYKLTPNEILTSQNPSLKRIDETVGKTMPDSTSRRELNVLSELKVTLLLPGTGPYLKVENNSSCIIDFLTLEFPRTDGGEADSYDYVADELQPNSSSGKRIFVSVEHVFSRATISGVIFRDKNIEKFGDSICSKMN